MNFDYREEKYGWNWRQIDEVLAADEHGSIDYPNDVDASMVRSYAETFILFIPSRSRWKILPVTMNVKYSSTLITQKAHPRITQTIPKAIKNANEKVAISSKFSLKRCISVCKDTKLFSYMQVNR